MTTPRVHLWQKLVALAEQRPLVCIALVLLATLSPFLDKAVHIDDALFVWSAEHIRANPADFYGFDVNWTGQTIPMSLENCNPPTLSYLFAAVITLFGENEVVLHATMLCLAFAAAAGIFQFAKMWCARPLAATLFAIGTPVFFVSATSLMCDVPMLAAWIWTIVFWERALRDGRATQYLLAGVLAGLSVLVKYSAITLLPLLPMLAVMRTRRPGQWIFWLALPATMIVSYEIWTARLYGTGLIESASQYATQTRFDVTGGWGNKLVIGLAYLGGCLLSVVLFIRYTWPKKKLLYGSLIVTAVSSGAVLASGLGEELGCWFQIQMILMLAIGAGVILLGGRELLRRYDSTNLLLFLWLADGFLFAAVLNWTVSARSFLPLVPAVAILVMRTTTGAKMIWPLSLSFILSFLIAFADESLANSTRKAAAKLAAGNVSGKPLWFQGHCGFQFYLQKTGAQPVDFALTTLQPNELMVVPSNNSNLISPTPDDESLLVTEEFPVCNWLTTVNALTGAGFYGAGGLLPYVFGPAPTEKYFVCRVLHPLEFSPPEVLNDLAWVRATSHDARLRNGARAVQLALRACQHTNFERTIFVGTLAAAYAEAGDFDQAIATAQKACDLAQKNGETDLLERNQELLSLYRQHQAYHEK